mgnify:CR=1 FL=1
MIFTALFVRFRLILPQSFQFVHLRLQSVRFCPERLDLAFRVAYFLLQSAFCGFRFICAFLRLCLDSKIAEQVKPYSRLSKSFDGHLSDNFATVDFRKELCYHR